MERLKVSERGKMNKINDKKVIRELVKIYKDFALDDRNKDNKKLHIAVNDLHPIRPIVLIDELPWNEMNFDDSLTLLCTDPYLRQVEQNLRRKIMQWKYFPADMILEPFLRVEKIAESTGIGVEVKDDIIHTDNDNEIVSHKYENQFSAMEDLDKLRFENIAFNVDETQRRYELLSDIAGDIMEVKICGIPTSYMLGDITWDIISTCMGVTDLLINMMDEEEFMHALVRKLTDIFIDKMKQYEALNLFDAHALYCHSSAASSEDLAANPLDENHVTTKNMWGRGLAQILTSVSPAMHDEFEIKYMIEAMEPFGLVYYGCCEALDKKIDIVKKIPNLRKICISPWADVQNGARQIKRDYVMSVKPSPAIVSTPRLDKTNAKNELKNILKASNVNNCSLELLLKDISTVGHNPQNIIEWEKIAMSMVK